MAESHEPPLDSAATVRTIDERAQHCFGCGPDNPQGLHLRFTITDAPHITATADVLLTRLHEGPPGYIHGGILATLMDEAMSKLNRPLAVLAMTRHLEVDYLRPAPLGVALTLVARHERRDFRKLFHTAQLLGPDGVVLTSAKGFFLVIDPEVIARYARSANGG